METTTRTNAHGTEVTETTWTVGSYTLVHTVEGKLGDYWQVRCPSNLPEIFERTNWGQEVEYGVNWSACGTQTPEAALDYAAQITAAATAAAEFTRIANA